MSLANKELDAHSRLMLYLKGWAHGAGRKAIIHEDQPVYMEGYGDGQRAHHEVAVKAQERFGAKLSVLRVQEITDVAH